MDEADVANEYNENMLELAIKEARRDIPEGKAGECDLCAEHSSRLINGACAPCRDKYKI